MGLTNGNITITCPEEAPLRFREGVQIQFLLSRAREQFGPGGITDGEGFEVSEEIDLDAGSYSFRKAAAAGQSLKIHPPADVRSVERTQAPLLVGRPRTGAGACV